MKKAILAIVVLIIPGIFVSAQPASGDVIGWGQNFGGEATGVAWSGPMPSNSPPYSTGMVAVAGQRLTNAIAVSAGMAHSVALRGDGTVVFWGAHPNEQAVDGFMYSRTNGIVTIGGAVLSNVSAIAAGRTHAVALKSDGSVLAWLDWGDNNFGQASVPPGLRDVVAISAGGNHTLALKKDGTVVSWGEGNQPPEGLSNVVAISASRMWDTGIDLALTSSGKVVQWNLRGVPGQVPLLNELTNVVAISAGRNHSLALMKDGTVFGWGDNSMGQATGVRTLSKPYSASGVVLANGRILSNVVAIAAGNECSFALRGDGTLFGWGRVGNGRYSAGVPNDLTNVAAVAVGEGFCIAITTNAAVAAEFRR